MIESNVDGLFDWVGTFWFSFCCGIFWRWLCKHEWFCGCQRGLYCQKGEKMVWNGNGPDWKIRLRNIRTQHLRHMSFDVFVRAEGQSILSSYRLDYRGSCRCGFRSNWYGHVGGLADSQADGWDSSTAQFQRCYWSFSWAHFLIVRFCLFWRSDWFLGFEEDKSWIILDVRYDFGCCWHSVNQTMVRGVDVSFGCWEGLLFSCGKNGLLNEVIHIGDFYWMQFLFDMFIWGAIFLFSGCMPGLYLGIRSLSDANSLSTCKHQFDWDFENWTEQTQATGTCLWLDQSSSTHLLNIFTC